MCIRDLRNMSGYSTQNTLDGSYLGIREGCRMNCSIWPMWHSRYEKNRLPLTPGGSGSRALHDRGASAGDKGD